MKDNKKDPICGMLGVHKAHGKWFCSHSCLRKYEKMHGLSKELCPTCMIKPAKWYKDRAKQRRYNMKWGDDYLAEVHKRYYERKRKKKYNKYRR